jgi:uncharacterized protein (DUF305 family)
MIRTPVARFVPSALVVMLLAAATPVAAAGQSVGSPRHTEADTKFMQGMIHHHAQAVAMAALVPTRSARQDLTMLAQRIDVSQVDEIDWMRTWLRDRGETVPAALTAPDAHAAHAAGAEPSPVVMMPGMLSADAMAALERASGAEFDRLFLEGMIRHHEGAIVMVAQLFATPGAGQESTIFGFASDVDADQRAEIARMRRLLESMPPAE